MRLKQHSRLFAVILFLLLAVSYLWCIVDNILTSAEVAKAGMETEVTAVVMFSAVVWLIGHSIHGVAFLALPVLLWSRRAAKAEIPTYWPEDHYLTLAHDEVSNEC